jgi:hypothetical protein
VVAAREVALAVVAGTAAGAAAFAAPAVMLLGGRGGFFDAGTGQLLVADFRTGNGEVVITEVAAAVPEPASIALLVPACSVWPRCAGAAGRMPDE